MSDIEVFDWNNYMSHCNSESVPETLFLHVENSLNNGIEKSKFVEIIHGDNPQAFWIAEIVLVCGHLLSVKFIGADNEKWYDLSKQKVYQLGWCKSHEMALEPPNEITEKYEIDYLYSIARNIALRGNTIPQEILDREGSTPIDRLKIGMKLEIQSERDPYKFWIATITRNVGGRLYLEYDGSQNSSKSWLFYSSSSLRYFGYVSDEGPPFKFQHPDRTSKMRQGEVISAQLRQSAAEAARMPTPKDLFVVRTKPSEHKFVVGMKVEALNPLTMATFHPATVMKIYDKFNVLIVLDSSLETYENDDNTCWLATTSHSYIFPVGWAHRHGLRITKPQKYVKGDPFSWDAYLQMYPSPIANDEMFSKKLRAYCEGFRVTMNLEAVNPLDRGEICVARIVRIVEHLLLVEMAHSNQQHWISHDSTDMFPVQWCYTHEYDLTFPEIMPEKEMELDREIMNAIPQHCTMQVEEERCDRIHFNYKCYAGTFISKNKLAQLPKYVGPGPLSLVIKEVMNLMISAAYKPGKLLKDLEYEGDQDGDVQLETLKAKLKLATYHAKVQVVSKNEEVPMFCREMCTKLQACPFLFGPIEITEQCPENCLQVDKSKFMSNYWTSAGRRKRRRGLHFMTVRAKERRAALEEACNKNAADSGNESDNSPSSTPQQSEVGTRPNSPDSNGESKKLRKKREPRNNYPPMEMKTRGAKLPNFAQQIKEGHWGKKDVQTIYSNSCVLPKKDFSDNSDSENDSENDSISNEMRNDDGQRISGVSDSEEPELKKLQSTPSYEPQPTTFKFESDIKKENEKVFRFTPDLSIKLSSNPLYWSTKDVYDYLMTTDCKLLAPRLQEEEIDGEAFMKLNLPIMYEFLNLKLKVALQLATHVANIVYYYCNHYHDDVRDVKDK